MEKALYTLEYALGSFRMDHEYAKIKGFMEGYITGIRFMANKLDL